MAERISGGKHTQIATVPFVRSTLAASGHICVQLNQ